MSVVLYRDANPQSAISTPRKHLLGLDRTQSEHPRTPTAARARTLAAWIAKIPRLSVQPFAARPAQVGRDAGRRAFFIDVVRAAHNMDVGELGMRIARKEGVDPGLGLVRGDGEPMPFYRKRNEFMRVMSDLA